MLTDKQKHRKFLTLIARYIVKHDIPGDFIECGVKQGSSSVIMAKTLGRQGYLFDTWKGFPHFSKLDAPSKSVRKRIKRRIQQSRAKNVNIRKDCVRNLRKNGVFKMCKMIKGDICKTVPSFVEDRSLSLSMMHIDTDICEPARVSLECFWPFLSDSGVVVMHDYGSRFWPGIEKVVNDFDSSNDDCCLVDGRFLGIKIAAMIKGDSKKCETFIKKIEL